MVTNRASRRSWLGGIAAIVAARGRPAQAATEIAPGDVTGLLAVNDLDREIWREELEAFVPPRLFDMHAHLWRAEFNLNPVARFMDLRSKVPSTMLEQRGSYENLAAADAALMPGRRVTHLVFGDPQPNCAFGPGNEFVAGEARKDPSAGALMMVHPAMSAEEVEGVVRRHGFLGFKPYLYYATGGDIWNARITEFMPEHQLAVANRYGLMIGMHLSKAAGIADRDNLEDLERLTSRYPRVRWVLFHNARSYSAWPIERAAARLRNIPNLWYEGSSVCETDAFDAAFSLLDPKRYCYGTDDFPVGVTRGKYIAWGHGWAEMNLGNQSLAIGHCDGRFSFVRYEMLRAMRRAARHASFTRAQIEDIFYGNGASLVAAVRRDLDAAIGG